MEKDIKKILLLGTGVAILLLIVAYLGFRNIVVDPERLLEWYTFKFDVYQTIIIGFLVAIVGLVVPTLVTRAKYNFEFLKDGRKLYSEVKTGIDYLPYKIPFLEYREALALIEEIHQKKHLVDLYENKDGETYEAYFKKYMAYEKLRDIRNLIKDENFINRKDQLRKIELVEEVLGKYEEKKSR